MGVAAAGAALVLSPLALVVVVAMGQEASASTDPTWDCMVTGPSGTPLPKWGAEGSWTAAQVANAAAIVEAGVAKKVPPYGWTVAVATAMQESSLLNHANDNRAYPKVVRISMALPHQAVGHDHDSVGLFQQRPDEGEAAQRGAKAWGPVKDLMTPTVSAGKFYDKLMKAKGWQSMALTDAAQAVQISGKPNAYAKWQADAQRLVDLIQKRIGVSCTAGGAGGTGAWRRPLPDGKYDVGSPFGPRGGKMHRGVDLMAAYGTPIFAVAAGTITYAGCNSPYCDRPGSPQTPGCGYMIEIQHAGNVGSTYCHASVLRVHTGQVVKAGDRIGDVGSTGHSSGNHLHFQVHQPAPPITNSTAIDPIPFMNGVGARL
jgi:murein DD-endopeptidase MepM/ murein hydrolase activator NlpD